MPYAASRLTRSEKLLRSSETELIAPTSSKVRCYLKREGGSHSLWANPNTGAIEAIPRHNEISNQLARKICRNLSVPEVGKN